MRQINEITGAVVDAAYGIHMRFGPGMLESVYESLLAQTLERPGLRVQRQAPITFEYEGIRIEEGFRVDLLVEDLVVVELKSVEKIAPVHSKQVLTYLRILNLPVGLLINFGAPTIRDGVRRIANTHAARLPSL